VDDEGASVDAPLTVIARLQAKPGRSSELLDALTHLVHETRKEPGCVHYDLYRSPEDPTLFAFHETWATREHWEAHNASAHVSAFGARAGDLLDGAAQVDPLTPVE
jgi:quinol monooxygenase YgiN